MEDKKDLLGKYTNKKAPTLPLQDTSTFTKSKVPYQAFNKAKVTERFKIYDHNGNFDLYNYGHLLEISFRDGRLLITTTTRIFILDGNNLSQIAELLGDRKIGSIYEFNADKHEAPIEPNAPIIESIERTE